MKVTGVITEYNPFHNGHQLHIENAKKLTNADYLIVVMSGSFVQRGEPAIMDKYLRTKTALEAGADLVIELPAPFSCASAKYFAGASVAILDKLRVVDSVVFGSECGDINKLKGIAEILANEPVHFKNELNEAIKSGLPYPAAMSKAVSSLTFCNITDILSEPNNMLGIEYIKALLKRGSGIKPITYLRSGSYNDTHLAEEYPSATAIRKELFSSSSDILPELINNYVPAYSEKIMTENYNKCFPVSIDDFSQQLIYRLLLLENTALTTFADVSKDLDNRIRKSFKDYALCSDIIDCVKTKAFTRARISRCLMHILLDITASDMAEYKENDFISYARILGFRKEASPLLSEIKKKSSIPLITKLTGYEKELDALNASILTKEIFASNLYQAAVSHKFKKTPPANEFTRGVIIL